MNAYLLLELVLITTFVISLYNFVRLYVYHDDDLVLRSVHDIIMGFVLIFSAFYLYKVYRHEGTIKHKATFVIHIYIFLAINGIANIVNSAKRLNSLKN